MTKRKIVYCTPSLYIAGGIERVLTLKVNYFADVLGYDIYIILTDGKNKAPYFPLSSKIHIINLNINFEELWNKPFIIKIFLYLKKQWIYQKELTKCLFQIKPDITISTLRREINFITSIKDGSKKIGEIHMSRENYRNFKQEESNFIKKIFAAWWMKQLIGKLKRLNKFIVLTYEDKAKWNELQNSCVIHNPTTFYPEKTSDCSSEKAIAVGRYEPQKGFDRLIEAWHIVHQQYPKWKLYIYGGGNYDEIQMQANNKGLEKNLICKPATNNIISNYTESSIFVLSSRAEGMPMALIEAMACGVPAVSFTCPCGPRDIIKDGEDGLLVENGNIEELANKICYLIENENIRKEMGQKARTNIQRFKIEEIAKQWDELFNSLLIK